MGDMLTLIEQAEKTFDAEQSAKRRRQLAGQGEFGLADFLQQMQMVRKMGPLSKVFGMLPGMGELKDRSPASTSVTLITSRRSSIRDAGRARQPQDHRRLSAPGSPEEPGWRCRRSMASSIASSRPAR